MADELETAPVQTEPASQAVNVDAAGQEGVDPFDDASWVAPTAIEQPATAPAVQTAPAPAATPAPAAATPSDDFVDEQEFLSKELGFTDLNTAKAELARLRQLEKQPGRGKAEVHKAIIEKEKELYEYFSNARQLNEVETLDLSDAKNAQRILKMSMQYKYKDLTPDDVDFAISSKYQMPAKPEQSDDETDGEYNQRVTTWQQAVKNAERSMIIDAKLARPDLLEQKSKLSLPDISIAPEAQAEPTAEEMQQQAQIREEYFKAVEQGIAGLSGFDAEYKDNEVTIPVKYQASPEEKAKVKTIAESLLNGWGYFEQRWVNPDGTYNSARLAEDLLLLESRGNVFQKLVNESASQRLAHAVKTRSNIVLDDGSQRQIVPGATKTEGESLQEEVFGDGKFV